MGRRSAKSIPANIIPVSSSFPSVPADEGYIWREAIAAIDRVHGDGRLPSAHLLWGENLPEVAHFGYDPSTGVLIRLNPRNIVHDLKEAFIHEIGHFLDAFALSPPNEGWASRFSPDLEEWRQAVYATEAYAALGVLLDNSAILEPDGDAAKPINRRTVEYYLRPQELFARSYSQWIIFQAGDAQLTEWYNQTINAPLLYPSLWTAQDFKPVGATLETLFRKKGWIT